MAEEPAANDPEREVIKPSIAPSGENDGQTLIAVLQVVHVEGVKVDEGGIRTQLALELARQLEQNGGAHDLLLCILLHTEQ